MTSTQNPQQTIYTIDEVCKTYCPIFYLHPNEIYKPYSLPDIMRSCQFEYNGIMTSPPSVPDAVSQILTPQPHSIIPNSILKMADTNEKLLSLLDNFTGLSEAYSPERKLVLVDQKPKKTTPEVQAIFSDPFVYMKKTYFTVTYLLFYSYNGTLEPHPFDQEYATFLFTCKSFQFKNNTSLEIYLPSLERIYLSSHGKGKWFHRDEFEMLNEHPYLYVALESHSLYNEPLVIRRFFGFGNDETTKGGEIYDPTNNVVVLAHPTSTLIKPYYLLNKLYYYNGKYEDQFSVLFIEKRTNILQYDGYYKVASTAELWEIKPFKDYKKLFETIFTVTFFCMLFILIDNNDFCVLISYICLVVFTVICIFLWQWIYVS